MKKIIAYMSMFICSFNLAFGNLVYAETDYPDISQYAAEILNLIEQCEAEGLSVDYERNSYNILKLWSEEYINDDLASLENGRISQSYTELTSIYTETKNKLEAYMAGTDVPLDVPKYITSDISIQDRTLTGYREVNGKTVKSPMFLTGYSGTNAKNKIKDIKNSGANAIQMEYGWENTVRTVDSILNWGTSKAGNNDSYIELVNQDSHSGDNCAKIVVTNQETTTNNYRSIHKKYTVKPNTTYVYGGWSKGKWFTCYGGGWNSTKTAVNSSSAWTAFSGEFTTDSQTTESEFIIPLTTEATLFLDDLYVYEKGSNVNLLSNGGFEEQQVVDTEYGLSVVKDIPSIEAFLKQADDENVAVDFLIYSSKLHSSILTKYPELDYSENGEFLKFDISSPIAKRIAEIHISKLAEVISKYNCVKSICLQNEPNYKSNGLDTLNDDWQEFLEVKYTDIQALNNLYGTEYENFSDIAMPAEKTTSPIYVDYREFNRQVLSEWHKNLNDYCTEEMPEIPVHSKLIQLARNYQNYQENGVDFEAISQITGLAGCDGTSVPFNSKNSITAKTMLYEYLSDISNKPVMDSESHVLSDVYSYNNLAADHIYTDLWQGAIHGRTSALIWKWDRPSYTTDNPYRSVLYRPKSVEKIGKANYDLNRLAKEVYKFVNNESDVAILYSDINWVYDDLWMSNLYESYYALVTSGCKPDFVTEDTISQAMDKKMIVVPGVKYISQQTLDLLNQYVLNDGILIFIGNDNIKYDEYGNMHNANKVNEILNNTNSVVVSTSKGLFEQEPKIGMISVLNVKNTIRENLDKIGRKIKIVDASTGSILEDVEWTYSIDEYEVLVNICNYDDTNKNIKILYDGEVLSSVEELISGSVYDGENISVKTNTPLLIKYALQEDIPDVSNPDGTVVVTDFAHEVNGKMASCILDYTNYSSEDEEVNVEIAVYDDNNTMISRAKMCKTIKAENDGRIRCTLYIGDSTYNIRYALN